MELDIIPSGNRRNWERFLPVQIEDHDISVQTAISDGFSKKLCYWVV